MHKSLAALLVLTAVLSGCTRNVDVQKSGAQLVPGTDGLYRFCDVTNLIYFSQVEGDTDTFEFFIPGGCQPETPDGKPVPGTVPPGSSVVPGVNGGN